ncbi:MAG: hypothetical protein IKY83_13405 [Proteobacteria bacterium]|nr:hypothetical protein [Pseudomonadota bacterium]
MAFFDHACRAFASGNTEQPSGTRPLNYRLLLFTALVMLFTSAACQSASSQKAKLIKNVEAYHRDLIFERYDIAAKNIKPAARTAWLDAMLAQHIRFTEIEVIATEQCDLTDVSDPEMKDKCIVVYSDVQWYEQGTPTVRASRMTTTWEYDRDERTWFITEQKQK